MTPPALITAACAILNVPEAEVASRLSRSRRYATVRARDSICYALATLCRMSQPEIAVALRYASHSSVGDALKRAVTRQVTMTLVRELELTAWIQRERIG